MVDGRVAAATRDDRVTPDSEASVVTHRGLAPYLDGLVCNEKRLGRERAQTSGGLVPLPS